MEHAKRMGGTLRERIRSVDLLRGIAALVVLVWHFQFYFYSRPFIGVLFPLYNNGQVAVDVFFVISGFILMHVYRDSIKGRAELWSFFVKRIARLYPLHLLALIATALVVAGFFVKSGRYGFYSYNDAYHFALNLFLLQFVGLQKGFSFNAPSWTISGEFWVNLLFAVILLLLRARIALISAVIVVSATVALLWHGKWFLSFHRLGYILDPLLIRTAAGFFAGVLTYQLWSSKHRALPSFVGSAALVAGLLLLVCLMYYRGPWMVFVGAAGALVAAPLLVFGCASSAAVEGIGRSPVGATIGNVSYSVYMWHFPVAALMVLIGVGSMPSEAILVLYSTAVVVVGWCSFHFLEAPARTWIVALAPHARENALLPPKLTDGIRHLSGFLPRLNSSPLRVLALPESIRGLRRNKHC